MLKQHLQFYYHELYTIVNNLLDSKAYEISNYLTVKGYPSIYLPRDGYGNIDILLKNPVAFFSHKHAAYLAGMGSFGENNVLLTKDYGPRVRFTSIFTSAIIEGDPITGDDLCTHCERCINQCPVNAIPQHVESDDNSLKCYRPMDKIACAKRSKMLRKDYKSPCGICIKVCPVGKDRQYSTGKICPFTQITVNIKKHGIMLKSMAADNLGTLD